MKKKKKKENDLRKLVFALSHVNKYQFNARESSPSVDAKRSM